MANTIPFPTFNWKAQDQIWAWEIFEAKAKLWLAGEEIKKELVRKSKNCPDAW